MAHAHLPKPSLRSPAVAEEKYLGTVSLRQWFGYVLFSFVAVQATNLFAVEFSVEGKIRYEIFFESGEKYVEQQDEFRVSVRDCNWHIRKVPKVFLRHETPQSLGDYGLVMSDGTNFYQVSSFQNALTARIGPGAVPFCLTDPKMIVLWYAYASSCYLSHIQDEFVNPPTVFNEAYYARDFRVRCDWQLFDKLPFLPSSMAFDGVAKFETNASTRSFTNAIFKVTETFDDKGLVVPKIASVEYFSRSRTNQALVFRSAKMSIEANALAESVDQHCFQSPNLTNATVSDMRTISSNTPFGIAYFGQLQWPNLDSSLSKAEKLAASARLRVPERSAMTRLALLRWVLIILTIVPAFYLIIRLQKHRKHYENTNKT